MSAFQGKKGKSLLQGHESEAAVVAFVELAVFFDEENHFLGCLGWADGSNKAAAFG